MKPTTALKLKAMLMLLLAVFGCGNSGSYSVRNVERLIEQNLKPGDPDRQIVEFFKRNGFPYSFNNFERRYQSYVPKSEQIDSRGVKSVITIDIYVNEDRSFKRVEVRKAYTYL